MVRFILSFVFVLFNEPGLNAMNAVECFPDSGEQKVYPKEELVDLVDAMQQQGTRHAEAFELVNNLQFAKNLDKNLDEFYCCIFSVLIFSPTYAEKTSILIDELSVHQSFDIKLLCWKIVDDILNLDFTPGDILISNIADGILMGENIEYLHILGSIYIKMIEQGFIDKEDVQTLTKSFQSAYRIEMEDGNMNITTFWSELMNNNKIKSKRRIAEDEPSENLPLAPRENNRRCVII